MLKAIGSKTNHLFVVVCMLCSSTLIAQQAKTYSPSTPLLLTVLDTANHPATFKYLNGQFEKRKQAETNNWHWPYYKAYNYAMLAFRSEGDLVDQYCELAEQELSAAEKLNGIKAECLAMRSLTSSARIKLNPVTRGYKYSTQARTYLEQAQKIDPQNPRVDLLLGQITYYTPRMFGGGKVAARAYFQNAKKKFESTSDKKNDDPSWGLPQVKYFLGLCNN